MPAQTGTAFPQAAEKIRTALFPCQAVTGLKESSPQSQTQRMRLRQSF
jgi:hypothetical protein